jgi:hypothetical protein
MEAFCVKMALSGPQEHELSSRRLKPGTGIFELYCFLFIIILALSLQIKRILRKLHQIISFKEHLFPAHLELT